MRFVIYPVPTSKDADATAAEGSCDFAQAEFDEQLFAAYMRYNEEMTKAGVLLASEGLNPATPALRVGSSKGRRAVVDGPFTESKELVGGFYLIEVKSREEAVEWAMRCPIGRGHEVLEIRQLTAPEDLPVELRRKIAEVAPTWSSLLWGLR
jgi:hypothetical protein